MKTKFLLLFLSLFSIALIGQDGLVSGNLNVTAFPTNNGDGTFTVTGTFSDPKGQYFAADVDTGMVYWKGNNFYLIDSILTASGSNLVIRVQDTYSTGFIPTGNAQVTELTPNLKLPGVSTTGDSNAALATPPDYAALLNYLIQRIDVSVGSVYQGNAVGDTTSVTNPVDGDVFIAGDTLLFNNGDTWIIYTPPGGGGGLLQYQATPVNDPTDNGCFVTTTIAGATYERTGGSGQNTEGILTVPEASILQGATIHFSAGQAPGNTFFLNVDYTGTSRTVNGSQNSVMPVLATVATKPTTFSDASPATNFVHSGTPIQIGIAQVDDNGSRVRIRYKITNYNQQAGANASILSVTFP